MLARFSKADQLVKDTYAKLTAWQKALVARIRRGRISPITSVI